MKVKQKIFHGRHIVRNGKALAPEKRRRLFLPLLLATLVLLCGQPCAALTEEPATVSVTHAWYALNSAILPGIGHATTDRLLVFSLTPLPGSYIYAGPSLASSGKPTMLSLSTPDGTPLGDFALYSPPEEKDDLWSGSLAKVYAGTARLAVPVPSDDLTVIAEATDPTLTAVLSGLSCTERNCTPFRITLPVSLPLASIMLPHANEQDWWPDVLNGTREDNTPAAPHSTPAPEGGMTLGRGTVSLSGISAPQPVLPAFSPAYFAPHLEVFSLGKALLLGFLAGILLNIMPCVLPVMGLKLSSLMAANHGADEETRRRTFTRHQIFFAVGIMTWFTALSGILAAVNLAWGQIFQSQGLVLGLCILLFLLALNVFGVFSLPMLDLRAQGSGPVQAFSSGFTATLLATPCSGPLLGGVLSWALLQPPLFLLVTLWSVGMGMSLPYILMSLKPALLTRLPKPGPWMRYMEGGLAFLLLAAAVYLATLLSPTVLPKVPAALLLAGMAAWLWGQVGGPAAGKKTRMGARLAAALCLAFALYWPLSPPRNEFTWTLYEETRFVDQLGQVPMLVEFTADWCPTCKVMEATTLTDERIRAWQAEYGFAAVRVDLTRRAPEGQELLRRMGSASIPLIALFPKGNGAHTPLVLRDIVTPGQLEAALCSAFADRDS